MQLPEDYMREALNEAEIAYQLDEVPIGAVIVKDGEIIARAHNMKEHHQLASSHAEMLAINQASKVLGTWCLQECDLYVTLEPCMMCTGAMQHARIRRLYYGTTDPKGGTIESLIQVRSIPRLSIYPREIYADILQEDCSHILKQFFKEKREYKKAIRQAIKEKESRD